MQIIDPYGPSSPVSPSHPLSKAMARLEHALLVDARSRATSVPAWYYPCDREDVREPDRDPIQHCSYLQPQGDRDAAITFDTHLIGVDSERDASNIALALQRALAAATEKEPSPLSVESKEIVARSLVGRRLVEQHYKVTSRPVLHFVLPEGLKHGVKIIDRACELVREQALEDHRASHHTRAASGSVLPATGLDATGNGTSLRDRVGNTCAKLVNMLYDGKLSRRPQILPGEEELVLDFDGISQAGQGEAQELRALLKNAQFGAPTNVRPGKSGESIAIPYTQASLPKLDDAQRQAERNQQRDSGGASRRSPAR